MAAVLIAPVVLAGLGLLIVLAVDRDELTFDGAKFWWLGGLAPLVGLVSLWAVLRSRRAMERFASAELAPLLCLQLSPSRKALRAGLVVMAICFLAAAILGPRWGRFLDRQKVRGVDIVVALDLSRSMLARDLEPNRLFRAKRELSQQLTERGAFYGTNRLGLVAFAGSTSLRLPLTTDHAAFRHKLDQLHVGSVPRGGTAVAKAIESASDLLSVSPPEATRIILLVTDGEDHEGDPVAAAKAAYEEKGIRVYTVAAGDPDSTVGAQVPENEGPGAPPLLHEGQIVFSKVAEEGLRAIAAASQGEYAPLEQFNRMIDRLAALERHELGTEERMILRPQYQWFAAICLLLLFWESALGEMIPRRTDEPVRAWQQEAA
jgi:Ca-activated chloride channel family protein